MRNIILPANCAKRASTRGTLIGCPARKLGESRILLLNCRPGVTLRGEMANVLLLSCLILLCLAAGNLSLSDRRISVPTSRISMQLQAPVSGHQRLIPQMSWEVVGVAVTLCSIVPGFWWLRRRSSASAEAEGTAGRIMRHAIETTGKD